MIWHHRDVRGEHLADDVQQRDEESQQEALKSHQRSLMMQRRCAHCAERVRAAVLLRAQPCPHCGQVSTWPRHEDAASMLGAVSDKWARRRWWFYGVLGASTFATAMLPLVSSLLTVAALIYARLVIVRGALDWFGPARRFTTRFTLRLWMLVTGVGVLVVNELLTLLPWANMPLKMLVSLTGAALFVEGSLVVLRHRLGIAASGEPSLRWWEWALPAALIVTAVGLSVAVVGAGVVVYELWLQAWSWLMSQWPSGLA